MTNAWFLGAAQSVPQRESSVRSTVEPLRDDNITAEAQKPPDWNENDTDESGELVGLAPRVVGSDTRDRETYQPWWARLATVNHNEITDNQVASSGTAAAREIAGEQGHGTMQYAIGIEPQIRDGAAFGNDFFVFDQVGIQDGAGEYMTPNDINNWAHSVQQSQAASASREAYMSTLYANFLAGGVG